MPTEPAFVGSKNLMILVYFYYILLHVCIMKYYYNINAI